MAVKNHNVNTLDEGFKNDMDKAAVLRLA